jgi:murein DD-endopeptidase MepM/ murein hydrolase activator NlpD
VDNTSGRPAATQETVQQGTPTKEERATLKRLERVAAKEVRRREKERSALARAAGTAGDGVAEMVAPPKQSGRLLVRIRRLGLITVLAICALGVCYPPFLIPVRGTTTSRFFIRTAPDSTLPFQFERHTGLDIAAPTGTRVTAARSGRVVTVASHPDYGNYIDIRHPLGWVTRYAHLSATVVAEGQWVWRRVRIGEVGMTGRATGPHLHFEVRVANHPIPPGLVLVFHQMRRAITG